MKIMLTIGAFSYGGAERVMCALANHLCNAHQVTLVTITERDETYKLDERIKRINGIGWTNQLQGILKLRKIVKKERPDLLISFIAHINIAAILACAFTGIPVIVSERNDPAKSATSRLRRILRKVTYPFASGLVFQTEDAKHYFGRRIQKRSVVIPNPIFLEEKAIPFDERENEIVSVGRFVTQKRQDLILKAYAELIRDNPNCDYKLTFYGDGEYRDEIKKQISLLGLTDRVNLLEPTLSIHEKIKHAKIFVLMSEYEGMPNALMEAMGLGLVCISSDCPCGGPRYLINDGENGFLIRVADVKQLSETLCFVIENDDLQKRVSKEAEKIIERLSSDKVFLLWDQLIERIMEN
jgi:glycosyltransferase involved in cell wall biosynthesis